MRKREIRHKTDLRRRAYLACAATALPTWLAGCLSGGSGGGEAAAATPTSTGSIGGTGGTTSAGTPAPSPAPAPSSGAAPTPGGDTPFLIAGTGRRYATMAQALAAAVSGDTIKVLWNSQPYVIAWDGSRSSGCDPRGSVSQPQLTIEWETPGMPATFDLSAIPNCIGVFEMGTACTDLTIRGIRAIGSQRAYCGSSGGNCFISVSSGWPYSSASPRYTLTLEYCGMYKWSNGVFSGGNHNGTINMRYCVVENCQGGEGLSHGSYVSSVDTLNVLGCVFRTTPGGITDSGSGALLKTRAKNNNIFGSLFDGRGGCNRALELDNGGVARVEGNVFMRAADPSNPNQVIRYAAAQRSASDPNFINDGRTHSLTLRQNTLKNFDGLNSRVLQVDQPVDASGAPMAVPTVVSGNLVAGVAAGADIIARGAQPSDNLEVPLGSIDGNGRYSGSPVNGPGSFAQYEFAGDYTPPRARSDNILGAFGA